MKNLAGMHFPKKYLNLNVPANECLPQIKYWPGSHQFCFLSCTDKTWETDNLAFIFPRPLFQPSNCCCLCSWVWYVNPIKYFSFLDSYIIYGKHIYLMQRNSKCHLYLKVHKIACSIGSTKYVPWGPYRNRKFETLVFIELYTCI